MKHQLIKEIIFEFSAMSPILIHQLRIGSNVMNALNGHMSHVRTLTETMSSVIRVISVDMASRGMLKCKLSEWA